MSHNVNSESAWLIGAGYMGIEYGKVLNALSFPFITLGRGEASAANFEKEVGGPVLVGGLNKWLETKPDVPIYAIVAVTLNQLASTTLRLLEYGVKNILLEKPGGLTYKEIEHLTQQAVSYGAQVLIAYNRRFYAATLKALEIIEEDGGVSSFNFEFTEWSHKIEKLEKPKDDLENWFLANSSHVVDLAFFLGGEPEKLNSIVSGSLSWYSKASKFVGSGKSKNGALFSYIADWKSPGRWGAEILTDNYRLIFKPLEKLQIQKLGSIKIDYDESINYDFDEKFKPGLYEQVKAFFNLDSPYVDNLVKIQEHNLNCQNIYKIIENI